MYNGGKVSKAIDHILMENLYPGCIVYSNEWHMNQSVSIILITVMIIRTMQMILKESSVVVIEWSQIDSKRIFPFGKK